MASNTIELVNQHQPFQIVRQFTLDLSLRCNVFLSTVAFQVDHIAKQVQKLLPALEFVDETVRHAGLRAQSPRFNIHFGNRLQLLAEPTGPQNDLLFIFYRNQTRDDLPGRC